MELNDRRVEEFLRLWKGTNDFIPKSAPMLMNFMEKVTGQRQPKKGGSYSPEHWNGLVRQVNQVMRRWNPSAASKDVFKYDAGSVKRRLRGNLTTELFQAPTAAAIRKGVAGAEDGANESILLPPALVPPAQASPPQEVCSLTRDILKVEFPAICQHFREVSAMSYKLLFDQESLLEYWSGPVRRDGRTTKASRILWPGLTCKLFESPYAKAKSFCMCFNSPNPHGSSQSCLFCHLCLSCGSAEHGFSACDKAQKLQMEAPKFWRSFGVDPLDPAAVLENQPLQETLQTLADGAQDTEDDKDGPLDWHTTPETPPETQTGNPPPAQDGKVDMKEGAAAMRRGRWLVSIRGIDGAMEGSGDGLRLAEIESQGDEPDSSSSSHASDVEGCLQEEGQEDLSPLSPADWSVDDVASWLWNLEGDRHRRYVEAFRREAINGKALALLNMAELKQELQVKELRNRKVIYDEIQMLFRQKML
ncbi:unnamed protein product [Effrenium voratum]|uniref:SAM domain-containing protein n=1 Tax=Effrenium voratum TaxID=2562239 RepID=A0AA36J2E9_9DINO|nr:unnamed protein product [Effrenium voratum]CAJ1432599.1 unnamed protein product [Effrenium voratum]